jgi:hypothetical protein
VIIIRFSALLNVSLGAGLTYTSTPLGNETIITITAGTDTVIFS